MRWPDKPWPDRRQGDRPKILVLERVDRIRDTGQADFVGQLPRLRVHFSAIHFGAGERGDSSADVAESAQADHADLHAGFGAADRHDRVVGGEAGIRCHRAKLERHLIGKLDEIVIGGEQTGAEAAVPLAVAEGVAVAHHGGKADAVAHLPLIHAFADLGDHAGVLVAHGAREFWEEAHPTRVVQGGYVGVADARCPDLDDDLSRTGVRFWDLVQLQRLVGAGELPCLRGASPLLSVLYAFACSSMMEHPPPGWHRGL
jgi:hypothetical protein